MPFNMSSYMLNRYHERRAFAIERLGSKCCNCESNMDPEIDHIDKRTKEFDLGKMWSVSIARFVKELEKCQLLCGACHKAKSSIEISVEHGGGLSGKKNCKCLPCKTRKAEYMREWKKRKRYGSVP